MLRALPFVQGEGVTVFLAKVAKNVLLQLLVGVHSMVEAVHSALWIDASSTIDPPTYFEYDKGWESHKAIPYYGSWQVGLIVMIVPTQRGFSALLLKRRFTL